MSGKNKVDKMPVAGARMHPAALVFVCPLKDRHTHTRTHAHRSETFIRASFR